jgi:hypothetical protein
MTALDPGLVIQDKTPSTSPCRSKPGMKRSIFSMLEHLQEHAKQGILTVQRGREGLMCTALAPQRRTGCCRCCLRKRCCCCQRPSRGCRGKPPRCHPRPARAAAPPRCRLRSTMYQTPAAEQSLAQEHLPVSSQSSALLCSQSARAAASPRCHYASSLCRLWVRQEVQSDGTAVNAGSAGHHAPSLRMLQRPTLECISFL